MKKKYILGIDAINSRSGGTYGYVKNLILHASPKKFGFDKVIIWGSKLLMDKLPDKPWLIKKNTTYLDKNIFYRKYFQYYLLPKEVQAMKCDLLFSTGGINSGIIKPFVFVNHNMLPYESKELNRAPIYTIFRWKMLLLRYGQLKTMKSADNIIFTSVYAKNFINKHYLKNKIENEVINNGSLDTFNFSAKEQLDISQYTSQKPFRLFYTSSIITYKHHDILIEAIAKLRKKGYAIRLDISGPPYVNYSYKKMQKAINDFDAKNHFVEYHGFIRNFKQFLSFYENADGFIYSSTCENMPSILIEYMKASRPIASSNYGPMPEFLKDAGFYYDPVSVEDTERGIEKMLLDKIGRKRNVEIAQTYAEQYSWVKCADQTMAYLADTINKALN